MSVYKKFIQDLKHDLVDAKLGVAACRKLRAIDCADLFNHHGPSGGRTG